MAGFAPPTPTSVRLGRALREHREKCGWIQDRAAEELGRSPSWVIKVEKGELRPRVGDVVSMLIAYDVDRDSEEYRTAIALARQLRHAGWWQRHDDLTPKYLKFIAFESEAAGVRNWEPILVPGLLQIPEYARAVVSVGREADREGIEQRLQARTTRQELLSRSPAPLRLHVIISEATLLARVGGPDVLSRQLAHIAERATEPHITVQVLRFEEGAHLANRGSFVVLNFNEGDPSLGYIETLAGSLFLEAPSDVGRLDSTWDHLAGLAMSPADSVRFIKERVS